MKKLAVLAAVALSAAFISFQAPAKDLVLNVSGTIKYQNVNATETKEIVSSLSFNERTIYYIVTNALAGNAIGTNGSTLGAFIAPTNMPANGYIAFNPYNTNADGITTGTFYVTNKAGFYYALSGLDTDGQYYSFIELDTFVAAGNNGIDTDYGNLFSAVASSSVTSGTGTSIGEFYVHDDPYALDDADYPDIIFGDFGGQVNMNSIEIRGLVTAPFKFPGTVPTLSSLSLTGNGNCVFEGTAFTVLVSSGHVSLPQ
jgi:hypothetical protein